MYSYPVEIYRKRKKWIQHTPIEMWVGKLDYQYHKDEKFLLEMGIKGFTPVVDNIIQPAD